MPGTRGPVPVPLRDGSRDLTREILTAIDDKGSITSTQDFPDVSQAQIKAALDRLGSRSMIEYDTSDKEVVQLSREGEQICEEGSHEYKVWDAVRQKGKLSLKELPVSQQVTLHTSSSRKRTETLMRIHLQLLLRVQLAQNQQR